MKKKPLKASDFHEKGNPFKKRPKNGKPKMTSKEMERLKDAIEALKNYLDEDNEGCTVDKVHRKASRSYLRSWVLGRLLGVLEWAENKPKDYYVGGFAALFSST